MRKRVAIQVTRSNMDFSVILPTYNERGNIVNLIRIIETAVEDSGLSWEAIVVDDNSPDGTAEVVRAEYRSDGPVKVLVRTTERGLASAIRFGIEHAAGDVVVVMDTDFQHDPHLIPRMVQFCQYYDTIVGSRFVMGGGMQDGYRYYYSYIFNMFVRLVTRTQVQDNLSGFFAMRRAKLLRMDRERIFVGYGDYFIRLLYYAWRYGYSVLEIPVFYGKRPYGVSKSSFVSMIINYSRTVFDLRLRRPQSQRTPESAQDQQEQKAR
jgi:dolichol-phosphate mannosyltransferase